MMMIDEILYGATAPELAARAGKQLSHALANHRPIALYGAGQTGRWVLSHMPDLVTYFLDDTPSKQGQVIDGIPVLSLDEAARRFGSDILVIVCIFSAGHHFPQTKEKLESRFGYEVIHFWNAVLAMASGTPNLFLGPIENELAWRDRYFRLEQKLADDHSRQVLAANLRMRLHADFATNMDSRTDLAFAGSVPENLVYVDGGAFDGDTIASFLSWRSSSFARIVAFEPDSHNFLKLEAFLKSLPGDISGRISTHRKALWKDDKGIRFSAGGGVASAVTSDGEIFVDTVSLSTFSDVTEPMFIKLDVEGVEQQVLIGDEEFIRKKRPILAISVYHNQSDLLDIFEMITRWNLGYNFYLRCHGGDGTDLTLYCIP